jgi:hypothetical protein
VCKCVCKSRCVYVCVCVCMVLAAWFVCACRCTPAFILAQVNFFIILAYGGVMVLMLRRLPAKEGYPWYPTAAVAVATLLCLGAYIAAVSVRPAPLPIPFFAPVCRVFFCRNECRPPPPRLFV